MTRIVPLVVLALAGCSPEDPIRAQRTTAPDPTTPPDPTSTDGTPDPTDPTDPTPPATVPPAPVWMSFSGGGYASHTAQAGWTIGMLEASGDDLGGLMANVRGISASSGGVWFLTQLAYSESFRADLEEDPEGWATTGYLGQTRDLYAIDDPCAAWSGAAGSICDDVPALQPMFGALGLPGVKSLDWEKFVEHVVYAPYGMDLELSGAGLDAPRQAWADGKSLVFGAALLTDDVVLAEQSGFPYDKDLYTVNPDDPALPKPDKFSPMSFASVPDPTLVAPPLFRFGDSTLQYTTNAIFNVPHESAALPASPGVAATLIQISTAASASGGAAASVQAVDETGYDDFVPLTDEEIASTLQDLAPAFRIGDAGLERIDPVWGIDQHAADRAVRLTDTGFVDNTAISYLVSHLADNGLLDDFTIVAFVNTTAPLARQGAIDLPDTTAFLFGLSSLPIDGDESDTCSGGFCLPIRMAQVFESTDLDAAVTPWTWTDGDVLLAHHVIDVTTVDNATLGVEGGHHGTLHLFMNWDIASDVLPVDADIADSYEEILDVTKSGVLDHGGWDELKSALNLP